MSNATIRMSKREIELTEASNAGKRAFNNRWDKALQYKVDPAISEAWENGCLALDKELAKLLGTPVFIDKSTDFMWYENDTNFTQELARWTQDDAAALRLAVEHDCYPCRWDSESIACGADCPVLDEQDFPDQISCVRYAIVQAVINKLKAENG